MPRFDNWRFSSPVSCGSNADATFSEIESSIWRTSVESSSNCSAQRVTPSLTLSSCAVTRMSIADAPEAAVDNVVNAEIASRDEWIDRGAVITKHAAGWTHDQTLHVAETSDECVSQSYAQIFVTGVFSRRTENPERKHRDRFLIRPQLAGNRGQRSEAVVQLAQQIVEARMTVKWIELRIDSHPKHLRVAGFISFFEQIECLFVTIERAVHEREVIWRHVTPFCKAFISSSAACAASRFPAAA